MRLLVRGCGAGLAVDVGFLGRIVKSATVDGCCYVSVCAVLRQHHYLRFRCCKWTYFVEPLSYFPYLWDLTCNENSEFLNRK